ncbi:AhpC/TSA family protein [bacterium SCSIO 12696]|nr:AhpC/TSA family protein [bacterium SCSIO 12696]
MKTVTAAFTTLLLLLYGTLSFAGLAESSADTNPLKAGEAIPNVTLASSTQNNVNLAQLEKPTIAIFYRGGWCPYCNRHLREIQGIQQQLLDMGYDIVGISPDMPEKLKTTVNGEQLQYQLLSDNRGEAARAFGIAFDAAKEYKEKYGDRIITLLEGFSGESHHQLPVPSVFILKGDKIAYTYSNPDYTTRLSADELLAAAKAAK